MNLFSYSSLARHSRWALFLFLCLFARAEVLRTPASATAQTTCPAVQFQTPRITTIPNGPIPNGRIQSVITADVNNDGRADGLALSSSGLEVLLNDGVGNLLPARRSPVGGDGPFVTADVNGDGRL